MAQTQRGFAKKLRAFADDIPAQTNEIKKMAAQEFVNQVVADTPKDTGQAKSNWITALGTADTTTIRKGPGNGDASLTRARMTIGGATPGQAIHVTNNLPYMPRLDAGYSKQAPAGFVKRAAARTRALIRRQRIRWKV